MRTFATLKNLICSEGRDKIMRNLNRILDIVILDVDIENSTLTFLYSSKIAMEKARRELSCIGFPILHMQLQNGQKDAVEVSTTVV